MHKIYALTNPQFLGAFAKDCEKRLLAWSRPPVHALVIKLHIWDFYENSPINYDSGYYRKYTETKHEDLRKFMLTVC